MTDADALPRRATPRRVVAEILVIALAYAIVGRLSSLLAIEPGYATPIWPAAGLALAATIVLGRHALVGIGLGSLAVNLAIASALTPVLIASAAVIAIGAALQAGVGSALVARATDGRNPLDEPRDVLRFLALGGPVACVVSATIGPLVLLGSGVLSADEYVNGAATWWVGDSIGVLVFAPLLLAWTARGPERHRRSIVVSTTLVVPFALAVLMFGYSSARDRARVDKAFEREANQLVQSIRSRVSLSLEIVRSVDSLFGASQSVERDEFRRFVRRPLDRHGELLALEWVPRVTHEERKQTVARTRAAGYPEFEFTELSEGGLRPAAVRETYYPVEYIEPTAGNEAAHGFDLGSNDTRRRSLERARDTGRAVASPRVRLVQDDADSYGCLLIVPIYGRGERPPTREERRARLQGFALGVVNIRDVVTTALADARLDHFDVRIVDDDADADQAALFAMESGSVVSLVDLDERIVAPMGTRRSAAVRVGDRTWQLRLAPTREFITSQRTWHRWLVLAAGLVSTGLFSAVLLIQTGRSVRIEALVRRRTLELEEKTAELARANSELEQFAYVASHDLQEPLCKLTAFSELLREDLGDDLSEDASKDLDYITDASARMRTLIQDLLALSQVRADNLVRERLSLATCVERACDHLSMSIDEKGARLSSAALPDARGDGTLLTQLFQNLVGNALKYSRDDTEVHVAITAECREGEWTFGVLDNGIGIAPEYLDQIFAPFRRLHARSEYRGTGIGLAICRKVVELHGGRIWAESEGAGKGTHVRFTLEGAGVGECASLGEPREWSPRELALPLGAGR